MIIGVGIAFVIGTIALLFIFDIDQVQKIYSIFGSLSIAALVFYLYKIRQDKIIAVGEQVAYFREEIMSTWADIVKKIKSKDANYMFSQIQLTKPTIDYVRENYSKNFEDQLKLFYNPSASTNLDLLKGDILDDQVDLLNKIEQFSNNVLTFDLKKHKALKPVKATFVEIINKNAVVLVFVRDVIHSEPSFYASTLSLYKSWRNKDEKPRNLRTLLRSLEKNKLITKQKSKELREAAENKGS